MAILLDRYTVPERGEVNLLVDRTFEIQISAEEARRQVERWLVDNVSYMMTTETPMLAIGENPVWRVPVFLTASQVGKVGQIGVVDVDVQSGEMNDPENCGDRLQQAGIELGKRLPAYVQGRTLPDEYWAGNRQATPLAATQINQ